MPASPDDASRYGEGLFGLYDTAETAVMLAVALAVAEGADDGWVQDALTKRALSVRVRRILTGLTRDAAREMARTILDARAAGALAAQADLTAAGEASTVVVSLVTPEIADDVNARARELQAGHATIVRSAGTVYEQVVAQAKAAMFTAPTLTRRQASAGAVAEFAARGVVGFVDKAGRRWEMGAYAEMAARTAAMTHLVTGHTDQLVAAGKDLVMASATMECCPKCAPYQGRVMTLTGKYTLGRHTERGKSFLVVATLAQARAAGFMHPNCRHRLVPYLPGFTRPIQDVDPDPQKYKDAQTQRAMERNVRELKRAELAVQEVAGKRTPEARAAKAAVRDATRKLNAFADSKPHLIRKPARLNLVSR